MPSFEAVFSSFKFLALNRLSQEPGTFTSQFLDHISSNANPFKSSPCFRRLLLVNGAINPGCQSWMEWSADRGEMEGK